MIDARIERALNPPRITYVEKQIPPETVLKPFTEAERQLTSVESSQLRKCEEVIEKGLDGFLAVGIALAKVRNDKLYRHKFDTFEEYCRERWDMSGRRARGLRIGLKHADKAVALTMVENAADKIRRLVDFLKHKQSKGK